MAGDKDGKEPEMKEKQVLGCNWSTWFKIINLIVGALMIAYSVFSFFEIPGGTDAIMVYTFKVYEM